MLLIPQGLLALCKLHVCSHMYYMQFTVSLALGSAQLHTACSWTCELCGQHPLPSVPASGV